MGSPDGPFLVASGLVIAVTIVFTAGHLVGRFEADTEWEARLVDDPEGIAATTSRVIAERAEAAAE